MNVVQEVMISGTDCSKQHLHTSRNMKAKHTHFKHGASQPTHPLLINSIHRTQVRVQARCFRQGLRISGSHAPRRTHAVTDKAIGRFAISCQPLSISRFERSKTRASGGQDLAVCGLQFAGGGMAYCTAPVPFTRRRQLRCRRRRRCRAYRRTEANVLCGAVL